MSHARSYTILLSGVPSVSLNQESTINVILREAVVGNSTSTNPQVYLTGTEDGIREGLRKSFEKHGNKNAKYVSGQALGLGAGVSGFAESENREWLKTNNIDLLITYNPSLELDYTSRVFDLGFLNIIYTLTILDFWWYDGIGIWFLKNNSNIQLTDINSGKVYDVRVEGARASLGYMRINNVPATTFSEAYIETISKSFKEL
jgi:hypothetical protein